MATVVFHSKEEVLKALKGIESKLMNSRYAMPEHDLAIIRAVSKYVEDS